MKKLYLFAILIALCSCGSKNSSDEAEQKKSIKEVWNGNEFRSEYFDLTFSLDSNWSNKEDKHATRFGGTYLDAKHLLLDKAGAPIAEINISYDKVNPFDREASIEKELTKSREGFQMLYEANELDLVPFEKKSFAKHTFILNRIRIRSNDELYYIDEYMKREGDYYLSMVISYGSAAGMAVCNQFLESIK